MSVVGGAAWLAVGWTMLHFLWVGGLIGIAAAVALRALRGATPEARYGAALASLVVLAVAPAVIGYREGLATRTDRSVPEPKDRAGPAPLPPPFAGSVEEAPAPIARTEFAGPASAAIGEPVRVGVPQPSWVSRLDALASRLPWIWLVGSPITFAWMALELAGAERLRRRGHDTHDGELPRLCRRLAGELGIAREVAVAVCERLTAPVLVGIVRPLILLPAAAMGGWGPDQVEMVLLHELAHVRRRDNLVNLLQRLIESALFFHPAVWIISGWVRREREHCCDAIVVGHTGRPRAYAEALLSLADRGPVGAPRAAVAMAGNHLVARVRRILNLETEAHAMKLPRGLLALTAAILIVPAGFTIGQAHFAGRPGEDQDEAKQRVKPAAIQGRTVDEWLAALKNPGPAARRRAVEILGDRALDPTIPPDDASRLQAAVGALLFTDEDAAVRRAVASFADRSRAGRADGDERATRRDQLRKLRDKYADLLKNKREALRKLAEAVGSDDRQTLALREQYALEHLHYLQTELRGVQSQKRKLEVELKVMAPAESGETGAQPLSGPEVDKLVERHPAVAELAGQLAERQRQVETATKELRRLSRNFKDEPSVKAVNRTVEDLRQSLARRRQQVRPEVIRQAQRDAEGSRGKIGRELAMLTELERRLADEIKSISRANQSLTVNTLDLQTHQDEIAQMQATMERIEKELTALDAAPEAAPPPRPAERPAAPPARDDQSKRAPEPARTPIRLVDAQGRPVAGAIASTCFFRDADRQPRYVPLQTIQATSDARGELALTLDRGPQWYRTGIYAMRYDDRPPLVGVHELTREEAGQGEPVTIVMHPACRVRLRAECPGYREVERKYHVEPRGERWTRYAKVALGEDRGASGVLSTRSSAGEIEFLLPPGRFFISVHGDEMSGVTGATVPVAIEPGHRVRNLGIVDLPPSPLVERGIFFDHHHFSPADRGGDEAAELFRLRPVRWGLEFQRDLDMVHDVAYSPDGRTLATAHWNNLARGGVRLWDLSSGQRMASLTAPGRAGGVEMLAFSPDGRTLAGVVGEAGDPSAPQVVVLWDIASRRESRTLAGHASRIGALAFASDGRTLATGGEDATVRTWDITDGRETGRIETNPGAIQSIAFSPDGRTLAIVTQFSLRIWDVPGARFRETLETGDFWVSSVAFSPDGRTLAAAVALFGPDRRAPEGRVRLYHVTGETTARRAELAARGDGPGLARPVHANYSFSDLALTPDGRSVVAILKGTIVVWDAQSGARQDFIRRRGGGRSDRLAISPDGRWLAATESYRAQVLDLVPPGP